MTYEAGPEDDNLSSNQHTATDENFRLGIDVGGTFTDFTFVNEKNGQLQHFKVPSTPHDPSEAIETGIIQARELGCASDKIIHFGHGTTVATNMVIERRGALTAMLTTKGFRDILEIGRQTRPHLYNIQACKPEPLVPRYLRLEVDERYSARGEVLTSLNEDDVRNAAQVIAESGAEAVAICFLHSYRFPQHEKRAAEILREILSEDIQICLSSEVLPEFREYERFSTTVMNAYLCSRMDEYLARLDDRSRDTGIPVSPYTVHSNGGLMSMKTARKFPVQTCLSGPAAGVVGASRLIKAIGIKNVITYDVGGTSTDVSLIADGRPCFTTDREVANYPVRCPMVDVHVIGAGGGSIAWIDKAGGLKVGPRSAGAYPGPAAYGNGGTVPTLTDANVILHRLNPKKLLGGKMDVDMEAAQKAVGTLADQLGIAIEECAEGIIRIAVSNMARAIRAISIERGYSLANFSLMAFGGAGPLHASSVAEETGLGKILIPDSPGTVCAQGVLLSDVTRDFVLTNISEVTDKTWSELLTERDGILDEAQQWLAAENIKQDKRKFFTTIDARYIGQNHEVRVPLDVTNREDFISAFGQVHKEMYGYDLSDRAVEMVNLRVQAVGDKSHRIQAQPVVAGRLDDAIVEYRDVFLDMESGWQNIPIYDRRKLPTDMLIHGPAIIEEPTSTTILLKGHNATKDVFRNLIIELGGDK